MAITDTIEYFRALRPWCDRARSMTFWGSTRTS
jgi:hypothetical protein